MSRGQDFVFADDDNNPFESLVLAALTSAPSEQPTITMEDYTLSNEQEVILSVLQVISGTLSLIGSLTIVIKILKNLYQTQTTTPYDRIILGLSSCDIIASAVYATAPFLMPADTSERVWAIGNDKTCEMLGFLTQLTALWSIWYNCMLSFYYLLTVRFQVKRHDFFRKYEIWMHISGFIFFPITALVALASGWYGEQSLTIQCWIRDVPYDCDESGTCAKDGAEIVGYIYGGIPIVVTVVSVVVNNIIIYLYVRKSLLTSRSSAATKKSTNSHASDNRNGNDNGDDNDNENENHENGDHRDNTNNNEVSTTTSGRQMTLQERLANEAAIQGFLYVSTFLLTVIPVFVLVTLDGSVDYDVEDKGRIYPLLFLNSLLVPLQGFFNVFIYIRPSFNRFRAVDPDKSFFFVLRQVLLESDIPRMSSTSGPKSGSKPFKKNNHMPIKISSKLISSNRGSNFSMSLDNIVEEDSSNDDVT